MMDQKLNDFKNDLNELLLKYDAVIRKETYREYNWDGEDEYSYEVVEYKIYIGQEEYDLDEVL